MRLSSRPIRTASYGDRIGPICASASERQTSVICLICFGNGSPTALCDIASSWTIQLNSIGSDKRRSLMSDKFESLSVEVADFVATVTLNRPPVNAQNRLFREEIVALFDELSDRTDVRAIVLTGAGKAFSAGADLKERPGLAEQ